MTVEELIEHLRGCDPSAEVADIAGLPVGMVLNFVELGRVVLSPPYVTSNANAAWPAPVTPVQVIDPPP